MELKTVIHPDGLGGQSLSWTPTTVQHDAAAAHALMRALGEIEGTYADCAPAKDIRQFLTERAEEMMREWGYEPKVTP